MFLIQTIFYFHKCTGYRCITCLVSLFLDCWSLEASIVAWTSSLCLGKNAPAHSSTLLALPFSTGTGNEEKLSNLKERACALLYFTGSSIFTATKSRGARLRTSLLHRLGHIQQVMKAGYKKVEERACALLYFTGSAIFNR